MGSYTFKWEHPASEVFVTGTFDDWGKTVKLEKDSEGVFTKTVELPHTGENVYYKFVKDGEWVTSHTAPTETDASGNTNNVLKPSELIPLTSSAAPDSSTAAMAANVPTEAEKKEAAAGETAKAPGAFPETPALEGEQTFSVNPIPASEGTGNPVDLKPGEPVPPASEVTSNTVQSTVHDDPELKAQDEAKTKEGEQTFSVNPIPASEGTGNPIDLKPGEAVPPASEVTSNTVNSTVKTDKESYEKSDAYPASSQPVETAGGMFGVPPVISTTIPESSLPMGKDAPSAQNADPGVTIQSAAPESTTAALAAQVPLEKDKQKAQEEEGVPEVVKESQAEAHVDPEASANPEAVEEKREVEEELLKDVKPVEASGEPAPTETAATTETAPAPTDAKQEGLEAPEESKQLDSRDVSPMSKPATAQGNIAAAAGEPATPVKRGGGEGNVGRRLSAAFKFGGESSGAHQGTPDSKASKDTKGSGKEKKRRSFFGKLKEAFK
ncbi:hypothetical protein NA57DRAFT_79361 [Rhizodiscina lignyota]|uniref:AMP-activated protein kinase glycogen-binding domain-containing protein n=1 Tax=Rhizodiscina lignyota TaxID=1504668 RepID=A0A9P4I9J6_9PEZI|nr:hypothetical protein NA57DRAFT_79361 [Rhizodiscina lignyota]